MRQIEIEKTVLQNNLRLVTVTRESEVFSMGIGIGIGSLYEDPDNSGISHMIEHMLFKGTAKRNMDTLNDDIEKLAGELDIYTTYHETVMTISIMKNKARDCMNIAADMLMNASFPEKELRLEKKVIVEEIKMEKDDQEECTYLGLYKAAFPEVWHKYHIAGTIKSIKSIDKNRLEEFYRAYYTPGNTAICIVSPYSHSEILDMVNESFGTWQKGEAKKLKEEPRLIIPQKVMSHKSGMAQAHILYGFDIRGLERKEEVALAILNRKIGAGSNSILFKELRDKKGYSYSVYSDMDYVDNVEMFYIYSCVSRENIKDAMAVIDDVVSKFQSGEISLEEEGIKLIKDIFLTNTAISQEAPSHIVDYLLDGELNHQNPWEYQNIMCIMQSINPSDIAKVASKVLKAPLIHILS